MISTRSAARWACLALLFVGTPGCGSGGSDASKDPSAASLVQAKADQIERFKAQSAKRGRPGARPNR